MSASEFDEIEVIDETNDNNDENDKDNDDEDEDFDEEFVEADVIDESVASFDRHREAVLCCALTGDSKIGASGGQDDTAFVFSSSDFQVLFECKNHKDSIIAVVFNVNDKYLASGDMKGFVQVWEVSSGRKVFDYDFDEDLLWLIWHPIFEDIILAGTNSGITWMLKMKGGQCKMYQTGGIASSCGRFFSDGKRAVVGYDDGSIRLWDLKVTNSSQCLNVHNGTVTTINIKKDDTLIASGSEDGIAKLIHASSGKEICAFNCVVNKEGDSVESVCFGESLQIVATGTAGGSIEIWDISSQSRRNACDSDSGVSKLIFDTNNNHLLHSAGLDGVVRIFDARTGKVEMSKTGHNSEIFDFCIANDSSFLLTASEDTSCRRFNLR